MKLTKALVNGRSGSLIVTPSWVTNGHWAARRDLFENASLLNAPDDVVAGALGAEPSRQDSDDFVQRVVPTRTDGVPVERSLFRHDGFERKPTPARIFTGDTAAWFVDERYAAVLDGLEVTGFRGSALVGRRGEEVVALVMPIRGSVPSWMQLADGSEYVAPAAPLELAA